ncbi:MAG: redoxin domain-containing protein [bacterium]|nr:redoxin domain-containing protein [bacterium]
MRDHEQEIREAGAKIAAVGLGGTDYARSFREETGIEFPLLVDERRRAYRAAGLKQGGMLHLLRADNLRWRNEAKAQGHGQKKFGRDPFQLGGSFVFGPGDRDLFAHVSQTFGDNAPLQDLLSELRG